MTVAAASAPTAGRARPRLRVPATRGVAWALLACCAALVVTALAAGERETSYDELRSAVVSGEVSRVRIVGGVDPGQQRGSGTAEVHWSTGPIHRVTEVVEVLSRDQVTEATAGVATVDGTIGQDLARLDPSVSWVRSGELRSSHQIASWRLPEEAVLAAIVVWLGTICLAIAGPQPWRATRWAWFWILVMTAPLGQLAFLLLGGSAGLWPPVRTRRRLTGGWAFLLSAFVLPTLGGILTCLATWLG